MKFKHTKVVIKKISFEEEFLFDMASGNGFIIDEPPEFTQDVTTVVSHNGANSDRFGKKNEIKYECKCGAMSGLRYMGLECPYCGGIVTKSGVNLGLTGWVNLGRYKIISPLYYLVLLGVFGKFQLPDMFIKKWIYDRNGHHRDYNVDSNSFRSQGSKYVFTNSQDNSTDEVYSLFSGIGVMNMYYRFDEILDWYSKKNRSNSNKMEIIDSLRGNEHYVFTSKIPVYTTILRPQFTSTKALNFRSIDVYINNLVKIALNIKNQPNPLVIHRALARIQEKANQMWDYTFQCINKKKGEIRGKILGGPLNYTGRNVCVLRKGLFANEIEIGYPLACIIYRYKIIYRYSKKFNISIHEAEQIVSRTENFAKDIYDVLMDMMKEDGLECVIIRNPTNNLGSILKMRVRTIVPSSNYHCIGVPSMVLGGLTCDFDGDVLNIIGLMTKEMKWIFRLADPIDVMITDKDTSNIRNSMNIDDSSSVCIYNFSRL